jgi:hypothetical protein
MNHNHLMPQPNVVTPSQAQTEFDSVRWALLNPWLLEGQADDRTPMNGSVKVIGETPWET